MLPVNPATLAMLQPPAGGFGAAAGAGGAAGGLGGMDPMTLAAVLGSVNVPEQQQPRIPQTTFPEVPRAMNPAFTQMVMQALQQAQSRPGNSLGGMLRGA